MTLPVNTITSVLNVSFIGLAVIVAITSVSTFITAVILYVTLCIFDK